ncbi:MAG: hypothetical protein CMJ64_07095 [Planctomycetaceae bacterium]|nr:hypothetical protein [Planctomycetaceae bacterium]
MEYNEIWRAGDVSPLTAPQLAESGDERPPLALQFVGAEKIKAEPPPPTIRGLMMKRHSTTRHDVLKAAAFETLERGVATAEHEAFVKQLASSSA